MSKLRNAHWAYTFDDFYLVPNHSNLTSRKEPDVSSGFTLKKYDLPIFSSPMNTVTEFGMANMMGMLGAGAVIHRYMSIEDQVKQFDNTLYRTFMAVGATGDYVERVDALYHAGCKNFCVDVANGHSTMCVSAVEIIKNRCPDVTIMAGDVCTLEGVDNLASAGASYVRVGIGPGSACSTRLVTGFGVPQLSALEWCSHVNKSKVKIIADGGIRTSGDIVKALAIGADFVMLGGLLAGTAQTPGKTFSDSNGNLYKSYNGMASEAGRAEWFDKESTSFVPEGASFTVPFKGDANKIINNLVGGLKVGMSYAGARTLEELREMANWVRVTENGRKEGNPNKRLHNG